MYNFNTPERKYKCANKSGLWSNNNLLSSMKKMKLQRLKESVVKFN